MEERVRKYRQLSPERAKVWREKSPKYEQQQPSQSDGKVPVVYYLCRNQQLEHPHFMEVTMSSPDGLYLRDVIKRFNVLRGKGMASSYSWSCKRSYKNRFVWHDLSEDDLILPARTTEYVLKGSEFCEELKSGRSSPAKNDKLSNRKVLPEPPSQYDSSPPSNTNERCAKNSCDGEPSLPAVKANSANANTCDVLADASVQIHEKTNTANTTHNNICTRGISTDDRSCAVEINQVQVNELTEIRVESDTLPPDTLISLIRSDVSKLSSFRKLDSEECRVPSKLKPHNMLMQLISCGSLSVKDHRFGFIQTYKPRLNLGKLDCITRNKSLMGLNLEDEEYICASWTESTIPKENQSSFVTAERTNREPEDSVQSKEGASSRCSKYVRHSTTNVPKNESWR
ncbi:hypothetical protein EJD97_002157 [Solanum chilense]|uniref:SOSEKI DIX-like domain-containing protein n=1 Tax=Solanum chilense TaxID=4083 RepID=A0A6N2C080_SOLCI|nr:hypothetical protein EJD97_002157 [Solanum chilense]